ncbi:MAG TPA: ATP-binding protein, partial [Afipia sp.]
MAANKYGTIADLSRIVVDDIREGVSLEYKSSAILNSKNVGTICKTISALANSAGGQFITGIESQDEKPIRLDGGFVGSSKLDWLHRIINSNTYPALENFEVTEFSDSGGLYYVIDVPVSAKAPHQSQDNRYYKRRGPHSDPMEHYEIEDIRNRPKIDTAPFRVEIASDSFLALLRFSNADEVNPITDLSCSITANFEFKRTGIGALNSRVLRRLAPSSAISFHLDTFSSLLSANPQAEINIEAAYTFKGALVRTKTSLFIGDFNGAAILKSPSVRALEAVAEKIVKLTDALRPINELSQTLERAVDASGLRLSARTLSSLRGDVQRFDPNEFDYRGYQIIADISVSDALSIDQIFGRYRSVENR